ncbi:MAG: hypothetical protein ABIZ81_09525 [Opitutaceae bacterium]
MNKKSKLTAQRLHPRELPKLAKPDVVYAFKHAEHIGSTHERRMYREQFPVARIPLHSAPAPARLADVQRMLSRIPNNVCPNATAMKKPARKLKSSK